MRVLLIHTNTYSFGQLPQAMERQRGLNPPISLAYIAAVVPPPHIVKILDMDAEGVKFSGLTSELEKFQPDVVGFSVIINNVIPVLTLSKIIKRHDSTIKIVFGGILMDLYPERTMAYPEVDIGVIGEGEQTFPELLDHLEASKPLDPIAGIIYKKGRKLIRTGPRPPLKKIDQIPFPARELLKNNKYKSLISRRSPVTIQFTSRGCPFHCTFCSKPSYWNAWRFHSPVYVVDEMEHLLSLGIKETMIYDDVFTSNRKRVIEICKEILRRELDISWNIRTRVDLVDERTLKWLHHAGCYRISFGVESGDPKMLLNYKKEINLKKVKNAFDLTRAAGMERLAYFMIGGPGETKRSIEHSIQVMRLIDPDYIHVTHVVPYPKTELFRMAVEQYHTDPEIWNHISTLDHDSFPMFDKDALSREEIFKSVKEMYRIFYYRPSFMLHQITSIQHANQLWAYFKAAIALTSSKLGDFR
ncbi:MAG: B12-binding domain-containing radical SAM protein [Promethearchaeota archaeon]